MSSLRGLRTCLHKSVVWRTSDVEKEPDACKVLLTKDQRECREAQPGAAEQRNEQHQPDPTSFAPHRQNATKISRDGKTLDAR